MHLPTAEAEVRTMGQTMGPVALKKFEHTVETRKPFEEAVRAIEQKSAEKGFRVLHTHDVAATLAEKGFPREALKIVEICNARYANEVLKQDVKISLMLPCPPRSNRSGPASASLPRH